MDRVVEQLRALGPALAFLLAAVPLADLLDRLGFFESLANWIQDRSGPTLHLGWLWVLAAATTAVLNLDTTIVLLTPLYVRIGRHGRCDPVRIAVIPLVLASLASSFLVVSNLTNLIVADRFGATSAEMLGRLGLPSLAAIGIGWWCYSRGGTRIDRPASVAPVDHAALRFGGSVVIALLVAFVIGPTVGIPPWVSVVVADVVLMVRLRFVPWRSVPVVTATSVAVLGAAVALVVPVPAARPLTGTDSLGAVAASAFVGGIGANVVNNLPALFVGMNATPTMTWGMWGWLWGINAAAAFLPWGALANLLWWRVIRDEGEPVTLRSYVARVGPIVAPAFGAGFVVLVLQRVFT